jgi:hypothetical protein
MRTEHDGNISLSKKLATCLKLKWGSLPSFTQLTTYGHTRYIHTNTAVETLTLNNRSSEEHNLSLEDKT